MWRKKKEVKKKPKRLINWKEIKEKKIIDNRTSLD